MYALKMSIRYSQADVLLEKINDLNCLILD